MPIKYRVTAASDYKKISRANQACSYFPCHKNLEDCTFCYCPFYPCHNKSLGVFVYFPKLKKNIWSCQDCSWIHRRATVERIIRLIRKNKEKLRKDIFREDKRSL